MIHLCVNSPSRLNLLRGKKRRGGNKMLRARTIFKSFTKDLELLMSHFLFSDSLHTLQTHIAFNVSKLFLEFFLVFAHEKRYNHRLPFHLFLRMRSSLADEI
jgi:hypothetical protein